MPSVEEQMQLLKIQREKKLIEKIETFIQEVNAFGPFQVGFIIVTQLHAMAMALLVFLFSFATMMPSAICHDRGNGTNGTSCEVVSTCQNYTLIPSFGFESMMTEWPELTEQTCRTKINPLLNLVLPLELCGGFSYMLGGILADVVGRKGVILAGAILGSIFTFISAFSTNYTMFVACSIIARMAYSNCWNARSLMSEYTLNKYRLAMNFSQSWCFALVGVGVLAYGTANWRILLLASAILGIPLTVFYSLYPESPRWLISEQKYTKAASALNCMALVNCRKVRYTEWTIRDQLTEFMDKDGEAMKISPLYSLKALFKIMTHRKLAFMTFVVSLQFFVNGSTSSTFNYNLEDLVTNPYITVGLFGVIRMWCPFITVAADHFGPNLRRKLLLAFSYIGIIAPLSIASLCAVLSYFSQGSKGKIEMTLSVSSLIAEGLNYGLLWVVFSQIATEAYPTVVRSGATAFTSMFGFIGFAFGPYTIMLQTIWRPLSYVTVLITYTVCFILVMIVMPETKGKPLPDNFDDLQFIFKSKRNTLDLKG